MTTITNLQTYPLRPTHHSSHSSPHLSSRTVGVITHNTHQTCPGYNLFSQGKETYLLNNDGRLVHSWRSHRTVFCAYLLPNGHLLRDGSDNIEAERFQAGGAAGYVECVTWENELVWSWKATPATRFLTHHDLQPLSNGGCLLLCWERRTKEEALAVGRDPELLPDGEVWDNKVLELQPNGRGGADMVWSWSVWDRLCQSRDPGLPNYVPCPSQAPDRIDINLCPVGGKLGCRDRSTIGNPNVTASHSLHGGKTGEKDWLHINAVSYHETEDVVLLTFNVFSELLAIKRSSGDIVWRWGNPVNFEGGSRLDQRLFCPHAAQFLDNDGVDDRWRIIVFNNGRKPDRHWSSVDELRVQPCNASSPPTITTKTGESATKETTIKMSTKADLVWTYGPPANHQNSFYCSHVSSVQRLPNGNTLVTLGPQGIVFEISNSTTENTMETTREVWRYVSPVRSVDGGNVECVVRQGEPKGENGRFSLFCFRRYEETFPAFVGRDMVPGRFLEG